MDSRLHGNLRAKLHTGVFAALNAPYGGTGVRLLNQTGERQLHDDEAHTDIARLVCDPLCV